ncbi:MAG: A/G-specific adenine glycosylase [Gammaproteobacteria bacterium]|nr:A/G-specific adenine glycosylase [Gammaproteobacteria bacterium]
MPLSHPHPTDFSTAILTWYDQHGRHDLPWQSPRTAYRVWVSEIMLQQTQVNTVIPYFQRFVQRFETVATLAAAPLDEVLHLWSGLGYYARARNLHKAAQTIMTQHHGAFPADITALMELPGIGRSTAAAILAQSFEQRQAILDGNVKRVLCRYHAVEGWPGQPPVEARLWRWAEQYTPAQRLADYTQAIMDLGATLCTRSAPRCGDCPLASHCQARALGHPTAFPHPKPRKTLPRKSTRMLLLSPDNRHVLLQQRPPAGIWGGLWSLPECPTDSDPVAWCHHHWQMRVQYTATLPTLKHSFSHYHLDIEPIAAQVINPAEGVMDNAQFIWYNTCQPDARGLPAPVQTLLDQWQHQVATPTLHPAR